MDFVPVDPPVVPPPLRPPRSLPVPSVGCAHTVTVHYWTRPVKRERSACGELSPGDRRLRTLGRGGRLRGHPARHRGRWAGTDTARQPTRDAHPAAGSAVAFLRGLL